jgi:hypothetical protein
VIRRQQRQERKRRGEDASGEPLAASARGAS